MPPPDPKSSTISPGLSLASAVGFPQPSEANRASSGTCPICATSYRFEVIGSQQSGLPGAAPQQLLPPLDTLSAACPYFSFTTSLIWLVLITISYLQTWITAFGLTALLRVQHSAYRNCSSSCSASVLAV